MIVVLPT